MSPLEAGVVRSPVCPICHGSNFRTVFRDVAELRFGLPDRRDILRCRRCGTHLTWPWPGDRELESIYEANYVPASYQPPDVTAVRAAVNAHLAGGHDLRDQWAFERSTEIPALFYGNETGRYFHGLNRVLDVGAYTGENMIWLQAGGWQVTGVEPNPMAVAVATTLGLNVVCGYVEGVDLPLGGFDAIYLSYVIEHVRHPRALLQRLRALLRPGGRLLLSTHNVASVWRYAFGQSWIHWHTPFHLFHTHADSLRRLAESEGFRTIALKTRTPSFWLLMSMRATRDVYRGQPPHLRLYEPLTLEVAGHLRMMLQLDGRVLPGDCTIGIFERPADN